MTKAKPVDAPRKRSAASGELSLAARAYEELRERIVTLYFQPGQYLNEGAISALLGIGRTPVHQALQRLQVDGLVEIMPRKGIIVQPDSVAEIIKILESRLTVEPELARKAAEAARPADVGDLKRLAVATSEHETPPDINSFTINDRLFHRRIGDLSGNGVMSEFARRLHERSTRFWYLHLWQTLDVRRSNAQHAAIAAAIVDGDCGAAGAAMSDHIVVLIKTLKAIQPAMPRRFSTDADSAGPLGSTSLET